MTGRGRRVNSTKEGRQRSSTRLINRLGQTCQASDIIVDFVSSPHLSNSLVQDPRGPAQVAHACMFMQHNLLNLT